MNENDQRALVRDRYGAIAAGASAPSCCGTPKADDMARRMGYGEAELALVPDGANLGLGCGNPQAIGALQPGEVVVDLGSGAGFDCFLAAAQVGPGGRVIGIDMTHEMLAKARANAAKVGHANVEFRLGEIEHLPVADNSADVVMSNCVINLSPAKAQVFAEAFRVLKPGGRLAVSDVVGLKPLPAAMAADSGLLCGCVAGAARPAELEAWMRQAGFIDIRIEEKPESRELIKDWAPGQGVEDHVVSAVITARKPGTSEGAAAMTKLEIYDPAMCCSTGVCGPQVDPTLVTFAADLKWLAEQGVAVTRYNLGQEPQAFAANPEVVREMEIGMDRLPIIAIDGHIVSIGIYPTRAQLAAKLGIKDPASPCCTPKSGCC
ncbi:Arsenical resistance operon trans-acting repressor ArsD (modular protein) [Magnetospirillum sp. LM-5]|uniref:arsenite efflux transporter metallochaperone ArsD n=1 Tax=Magnetospirillum sp. LM-5 TaxID=2681466 RepID=UPI00137D2016|nr:arsenite efflux transporter metallochaperone ArsD [Magnetospirillum sp. LM-5]CAA7622059.1 Arsenical resistance operon trans-acting repressor ArsD (modular protein) [Magnetospirillum sp. LM-5]